MQENISNNIFCVNCSIKQSLNVKVCMVIKVLSNMNVGKFIMFIMKLLMTAKRKVS